MTQVYFDNKLWMHGGMKYQERQLDNEVWYSKDGITWQQAEHAPWTVRSGVNSVVFKDQLWLYRGKHTGGNPV